ncbi:MAG: hypothetical protein U0237_05280 [Thermoleophilia bacterium]
MTTHSLISMPLPGGLLGAQATTMLILLLGGAAAAGCWACTYLCRAGGERLPARTVGVAAQFAIVLWAANGGLLLAGAPTWAFTLLDVVVVGVAVLTAAILGMSWRLTGRSGPAAGDQVTGAPQTGNQRSSSASIGSSRPSAA